ncbi:ParB N-terminal domain-containing protein [Vibrio parahaemolyticus]|uniref:ParB N-terminal domain-containing protein n=1 Tax=Vibrio parahaemolyticus TaxID=670 RepID=UPI0009F01915|nr:ParB N-terminal domain-containing protein [Vibrio parahaemolyticus]OQU28093.1 hypothetical protein EM47_001220 [Vibrio parahaemolyticus]
MKHKTIPIKDIVVQERERKVNNKKVHELAKSIHTLGLISPIVVTSQKILVAGAHRLEAYKLLGLEEIESRVLESDEDARLVELDENYKRNDLTPTQRKQHMLKRISEIKLRFRDEIYDQAIQESIDSKNLSPKDKQAAIDTALGYREPDTVKPKIREVAKKAQNKLEKLAVEVVEGEYGCTQRAVRDVIRAEKKSATPMITFDEPEKKDPVVIIQKKTKQQIRKLVLTLQSDIKSYSVDSKELNEILTKLEELL